MLFLIESVSFPTKCGPIYIPDILYENFIFYKIGFFLLACVWLMLSKLPWIRGTEFTYNYIFIYGMFKILESNKNNITPRITIRFKYGKTIDVWWLIPLICPSLISKFEHLKVFLLPSGLHCLFSFDAIFILDDLAFS